MGGQRQKMNAIATILTESPPIPLQISQQLMLKLNTSDPGRKWGVVGIRRHCSRQVSLQTLRMG